MSKAKKLINKMIAKSKYQDIPIQPPRVSWLELLTSQPELAKSIDFRVEMTVSCRDSDYIPKVKNAGSTRTIKGKQYQVMHNGLLVESGGYFNEWMARIIEQLKGHHEPQEEKMFHEVLKHVPEGSSMIELGSYWSYYSLWFNMAIPKASNYCCEPDPVNLDLGKRNSAINGRNNMNFIQSAAGSDDGKIISFQPQEDENRLPVKVMIRSVDSLVKEYGLNQIGIVHMDVQGVELSAIEGASKSIKAGLIKFMFVSTHHYAISEDPLTHEKCIELIERLGGNIVAEHAIHESFSGDGLIVASFMEKDKNLKVEISSNRMKDSLFRSYTNDLSTLVEAYKKSSSV